MHYDCWCIFVECCRLFCLPVLYVQHINRAHCLLIEFCTVFESLYGSTYCTPNMHMACHLRECILDYGPLSSFWLFAFERYNGILENFQKSWLGPEKQMLQKLLHMQHLYSLDIVNLCQQDDFLSAVFSGNEHIGVGYSSFDQTKLQDLITVKQIENFSCPASSLDAMKKPYHVLIPPYKEKCFCHREILLLKQVYAILYPTAEVIELSHFVCQYKRVLINGEDFISTSARSQRSSAIVAHWLSGSSSIDITGTIPLRVGIIEYFLTHKVELWPSENY